MPAILSLFLWKYMNLGQRWFAILLWFVVAISFAGEIWLWLGGESNLPFFHVYILIECLFIIRIFAFLLNNALTSTARYILSFGFSGLWLVNVLVGEGWRNYPDYIHALEALIILTLVFKWFLKMLREKTITRPQKTFEFWLCTGLLVFFSGNFLLFLFSEFLLTIEMSAYYAIWKLHIILNLVLYLIYTLALSLLEKRRHDSVKKE
ncbi:MAG: hypothetical protein AAF489_13505 [Bacteroidota bacterium]